MTRSGLCTVKKTLNICLENISVILLHLCSYELSSGYRPAPLDLSHIKLTLTQEAMVDKLAENAHNAWAKDRIRQGWTYGIQQVQHTFYVFYSYFTGRS